MRSRAAAHWLSLAQSQRSSICGSGLNKLAAVLGARNTAAHLLRPDPHMLDLCDWARDNQCAAARDRIVDDRHEDFVVGYEFRGDGEVDFPIFHPVFGISPMTFRGMSDSG